MAKLNRAGIGDVYLKFLSAYLEPRIGRVSIAGFFSDAFAIADSVFQGTVLGPTLWNVFFADVMFPARMYGGKESMFADDLNVFQQFQRSVSNADIKSNLADTQREVHKWGDRFRVTFDASKEHFIIIHPVDGEGDTVKLLGNLDIDTKLDMDDAISSIVSKTRPEVTTMVRTRTHYASAQAMTNQYKTHVWGYAEYQNGCIAHAAPYKLERLENIHRHFLDEIEITEQVALLDYNFAPPVLRRDIRLLGLIHKRAVALAHPAFSLLLPLAPASWYTCRFPPRHNKQLDNGRSKVVFRHAIFNRSLFGLVDIYNRLPQEIVDRASVKEFQHDLTCVAKQRCEDNIPDWRLSFNAHFHSDHAFVSV